MNMNRRKRHTEYGKFLDEIYQKLHGKDIHEFSNTELDSFVEGFTTISWQLAAGLPDKSKEFSARHFVAQSFLENQGKKQDLKIYHRDKDITKSLQKDYHDFVLNSSRDELYSAELEQFLSYLEGIVKEELNYLNISSTGLSKEEYDLFSAEVSNDAYYKLIFSMYLCAQWYRTPTARQQISKMDSKVSYDSQVFSAINSKSSILAKKTWFWIYDDYSSVWFPPNPFFLYSIKVKDLPKEFIIRDGITLKGNEDKYYHSLDTSHAQMMPFAQHLLLYIFDEVVSKEPHCWERGLDSSIQLKSFYSSDGKDRTFYNYIIKYLKTTNEVLPSSSFFQAKKVATVTLKSIRMSEIAFAEYNYVTLSLNEWVMVFKNDKYAAARFNAKTYFDVPDTKEITA